jgi:hypothetical protein
MQPNYYQPYQNNYQYQQSSYQQPMQRTMFAMINGIEDVRTFIVQPNQTVYLLDTTSNHFYIKKADMSDNYNKERLKELPLDKQQWFEEKYGKQLIKLNKVTERNRIL